MKKVCARERVCAFLLALVCLMGLSTGACAVEMSMLDWQTEENCVQGVQEEIRLFEANHPGVTIEVETADDTILLTTFKARLYSGDAPDLVQGKPQNMQEFIDAGYILDLSDYDFMKDLNPEYLKEVVVGGKYWGFPADIVAKGVLYNKTMFAQMGVEVPTTRDAFFAVLDKFAQAGINPFMQPLEAFSNCIHIIDCVSRPIASVNGNPTLFTDALSGKAPLADNPLAHEIFEFYNQFLTYRDANDPSYSVQEAGPDFAVGVRPMFLNGVWCMQEILGISQELDNGFEYGIFPLPWSNNPEENKLLLAVDSCYLVCAEAANAELATEFLRSMASEEGAKIWWKYFKNIPGRQDVALEDMPPYVEDMMRYMDEGKVVMNSEVDPLGAEAQHMLKVKIQEFACKSDAERDVGAFLRELDAELIAIGA